MTGIQVGAAVGEVAEPVLRDTVAVGTLEVMFQTNSTLASPLVAVIPAVVESIAQSIHCHTDSVVAVKLRTPNTTA